MEFVLVVAKYIAELVVDAPEAARDWIKLTVSCARKLKNRSKFGLALTQMTFFCR
jgi:hypothetical protein